MNLKRVNQGNDVNKLEFLATVPLWAVYMLAARVEPGKQIIAHMSYDEDLPAVSLYVRKAA